VKVSVAEMDMPHLCYWSAPMPAVPKKARAQSKAMKIIFRMVCIVSFCLASYGFVTCKSGFHAFLVAALMAAIGAGDISPTTGIIEAMRLFFGKGK
jgi:hypothetical protein